MGFIQGVANSKDVAFSYSWYKQEHAFINGQSARDAFLFITFYRAPESWKIIFSPGSRFGKSRSLVQHTVNLRQECHNSKFGSFELLV